MEPPQAPPSEVAVVPADQYLEMSQRSREREVDQNARIQNVLLKLVEDMGNEILKDNARKRRRIKPEEKVKMIKAMSAIANSHTMKQKNQIQLGPVDIKPAKISPAGNKPPQSPPPLQLGQVSSTPTVIAHPKS